MNWFASSRLGNARLLSCLLGALGSHGALFLWCAGDLGRLHVESVAVSPAFQIEVSVSTDASEAFSNDAPPTEVQPSEARAASLRPTTAEIPKARVASALPVSTVPARSAPDTENSPSAGERESEETALHSLRDGGAPGSLAKGGVTSASGRGAERGASKGAASAHRAKHDARLMARTAACSDLFPHDSRVTRTELTVTLAVDPKGHAKLVHLDRNHPLVGQFAPAAQACTKRLRFAPARDAGGDAMASVAKVKLVFRRES